MKKNDEMIKRVNEEFGDRVPNFAIMNLKMFIKAIEDYEKVGPIDIRNKENVENKNRIAYLGKLVNRMADASVWYDVLMERYGLEWPAIEAQIKEPDIDKSVRAID